MLEYDDDYDRMFKLCLIGRGSTGKSSILRRYTKDEFNDDGRTIGVDFGTKKIEIAREKYKLQIWDTAGTESFHSVTAGYYRGTSIFFICYDIANTGRRDTFADIDFFLTELEKDATCHCIKILVGTRADLPRAISQKVGKAYAKEHGLLFLECSAKTGKNVDLLFRSAVQAGILQYSMPSIRWQEKALKSRIISAKIVNEDEYDCKSSQITIALADRKGQRRDYFLQLHKSHGFKLKKFIIQSSGQIFLVCYDITNLDSFRRTNYPIKLLKKYANPFSSIILVGTKSEIERQRKVTRVEAQEYAYNHNIHFFEHLTKFEEHSFERLIKHKDNINLIFQIALPEYLYYKKQKPKKRKPHSLFTFLKKAKKRTPLPEKFGMELDCLKEEEEEEIFSLSDFQALTNSEVKKDPIDSINAKEKKGSMKNRVGKPRNNGYVRHAVSADGDCGYGAFGITRKQAYVLISANIAQPTIGDLLKPMVRQLLLDGEFFKYLKEKRILEEGVQYGNVEKNLELRIKDASIIAACIDYDIRDKKVDAGWAHPCVLQALAHIQKITLHIWRLGENEKLIPHSKTYGEYIVQGASETKDLLFINKNHFELVTFEVVDLQVKKNSIYPPRSSWGQKKEPLNLMNLEENKDPVDPINVEEKKEPLNLMNLEENKDPVDPISVEEKKEPLNSIDVEKKKKPIDSSKIEEEPSLFDTIVTKCKEVYSACKEVYSTSIEPLLFDTTTIKTDTNMTASEKAVEIPNGFECAISCFIMRDPVILVGDENTYEREMIKEWLRNSNKSPITRKVLTSKALVANINLKKSILDFLEKHPEYKEEVYKPTQQEKKPSITSSSSSTSEDDDQEEKSASVPSLEDDDSKEEQANVPSDDEDDLEKEPPIPSVPSKELVEQSIFQNAKQQRSEENCDKKYDKEGLSFKEFK